MSSEHRRMNRERKTISAMVHIYCQDHHDAKHDLCSECDELLDYAQTRLDKCPYQEGKTTCANCPIHCYKPDKREQVRTVMRYSGPRMLYRHPILTLYHFIDGRRKEPVGYKRPSRSS
jgi:predicted amidophosphoribosyltransferase